MEKYKGIRFDTGFNRALEICQEEVAKNPDYLIIHYDMESGWPMVISKVQQKKHAEIWDACKPKINGYKGVQIVFGTPEHVVTDIEKLKDTFKSLGIHFTEKSIQEAFGTPTKIFYKGTEDQYECDITIRINEGNGCTGFFTDFDFLNGKFIRYGVWE